MGVSQRIKCVLSIVFKPHLIYYLKGAADELNSSSKKKEKLSRERKKCAILSHILLYRLEVLAQSVYLGNILVSYCTYIINLIIDYLQGVVIHEIFKVLSSFKSSSCLHSTFFTTGRT